MKKINILLLCFLTISCSSFRNFGEITYTDPGFYSVQTLRLKVVPTFSSPFIYEITRHNPYLLTITKFKGAGGYDWKEPEYIKEVPLSEKQYKKIVSLLDKTLETAPRKDDYSGLDGETWFLETALYNYTGLAYWVPESDTAKRSLTDFVNLKKHLEKLSNVQ